MSILPELRLIACKLSRREFEREHPGLYLLATLPDEEHEEDFEFHTALIQDPTAQTEAMLAKDAAELLANNRLYLVAKTPRNPWNSKITIGRASNNDVILRHASVSKLHAFFEVRGATPTTLVDAGSANGTVVNGFDAPADEPVAVEPGSLLRVGDVECELLDAGQLHEAIRALFPTAALLREE